MIFHTIICSVLVLCLAAITESRAVHRLKRQSFLERLLPGFPSIAPIAAGTNTGVNVDPLNAIGDQVGISNLGGFGGGDAITADIKNLQFGGGTSNCFAGVCSSDKTVGGDIDGQGTLGGKRTGGLDLSAFGALLGFNPSVINVDQTGYNPFTGTGSSSKGLNLPFGISTQQSSGFKAPGINDITNLLQRGRAPVTPATTRKTTTVFSFLGFLNQAGGRAAAANPVQATTPSATTRSTTTIKLTTQPLTELLTQPLTSPSTHQPTEATTISSTELPTTTQFAEKSITTVVSDVEISTKLTTVATFEPTKTEPITTEPTTTQHITTQPNTPEPTTEASTQPPMESTTTAKQSTKNSVRTAKPYKICKDIKRGHEYRGAICDFPGFELIN